MDEVTAERIRHLEIEQVRLQSDVESLKNENSRLESEVKNLKSGIGRGLWILGGGFITSFVAWVVGGGLAK